MVYFYGQYIYIEGCRKLCVVILRCVKEIPLPNSTATPLICVSDIRLAMDCREATVLTYLIFPKSCLCNLFCVNVKTLKNWSVLRIHFMEPIFHFIKKYKL